MPNRAFGGICAIIDPENGPFWHIEYWRRRVFESTSLLHSYIMLVWRYWHDRKGTYAKFAFIIIVSVHKTKRQPTPRVSSRNFTANCRILILKNKLQFVRINSHKTYVAISTAGRLNATAFQLQRPQTETHDVHSVTKAFINWKQAQLYSNVICFCIKQIFLKLK